MRYVSEERLESLLKAQKRDLLKGFLEGIISQCEELPEEEELRPMSDAPPEVPILVDTGEGLREAFVSKDGVVDFSDCNLFKARALGWRPI